MAFVSSQGAELQVEISSVFTPIPQLQGFPWPAINTQFENVTTLDASGNFMVYNAIMNDTGEISCTGFWDPANAVHDFLMDNAILATKTALNFKAIANDAGDATMTFSAFVMGFAVTAEQNASMKFTLTLRVSGAITYAP